MDRDSECNKSCKYTRIYCNREDFSGSAALGCVYADMTSHLGFETAHGLDSSERLRGQD